MLISPALGLVARHQVFEGRHGDTQDSAWREKTMALSQYRVTISDIKVLQDVLTIDVTTAAFWQGKHLGNIPVNVDDFRVTAKIHVNPAIQFDSAATEMNSIRRRRKVEMSLGRKP